MDKKLSQPTAKSVDHAVHAQPALSPECTGCAKGVPVEPLRSSLADEPDLHVVIDLFLEELPGQLEAIEVALGDGDIDRLQSHLHALKGASGSAGFEPVMQQAARFESLVRQGQLEACGDQLAQLCGLCQAVSGFESAG